MDSLRDLIERFVEGTLQCDIVRFQLADLLEVFECGPIQHGL